MPVFEFICSAVLCLSPYPSSAITGAGKVLTYAKFFKLSYTKKVLKLLKVTVFLACPLFKKANCPPCKRTFPVVGVLGLIKWKAIVVPQPNTTKYPAATTKSVPITRPGGGLIPAGRQKLKAEAIGARYNARLRAKERHNYSKVKLCPLRLKKDQRLFFYSLLIIFF